MAINWKGLEVFLILLAFTLVTHAQQCGSNQFTIRNENGEDYLVINSPTVVKTCGGLNICDELNSAKQSLSMDKGMLSISEGNSVQLPDDSSANEIQTLALDASGTLSISQGNKVTLGDNSPTNEIQTLSLDSAGRLSISLGNQVLLSDNSATNEIQSLSIDSSGKLSISQSNQVILPDTSDTNEIQTLTLDSAGKLSISQGNQVLLGDNSSANELQTLSLDPSGTLSISQGNQVTLADNSASNELQSLSLSGTSLSISSGNTVNLAAVPTVRAAFVTPASVTIATVTQSPPWSKIGQITVTPPGPGNILTKWCGTILSPATGIKGFSFGFVNSTSSVTAFPFGKSAVFEASDGESFFPLCTEWWWTVGTPGVAVTFSVNAQTTVSSCSTYISQLSAYYYYGTF